MMGLDKLLRGRFGSVPYIDLDRKLTRIRVPEPTTFDFRELADGVKRNNLGLGGFVLEADADVRGGRVALKPTGQSFPLDGPPGPGRYSVLDWNDPAKTRLKIVP